MSNRSPQQLKIYHIIFDHDSPAARRFDIVLLWTIVFSILVVVFDSITHFKERYTLGFRLVEWLLTLLFTAEYVLRIWSHPKPIQYIISGWGIVDLLAILPSYLGFFFGSANYLITVRVLRLLRVFRILHLAQFSSEARFLLTAIKNSGYKIIVFFSTVLTIVVVLGTVMYVLEGEENGFTSIPQGIYWAIVTVTTVGFGDVVPQTVAGKIISSVAMILGYAIIAVPTGIITVQMSKQASEKRRCIRCEHELPDQANYCSQCGEKQVKTRIHN